MTKNKARVSGGTASQNGRAKEAIAGCQEFWFHRSFARRRGPLCQTASNAPFIGGRLADPSAGKQARVRRRRRAERLSCRSSHAHAYADRRRRGGERPVTRCLQAA